MGSRKMIVKQIFYDLRNLSKFKHKVKRNKSLPYLRGKGLIEGISTSSDNSSEATLS